MVQPGARLAHYTHYDHTQSNACSIVEQAVYDKSQHSNACKQCNCCLGVDTAALLQMGPSAHA
jgi:hypothetical protein